MKTTFFITAALLLATPAAAEPSTQRSTCEPPTILCDAKAEESEATPEFHKVTQSDSVTSIAALTG